MASKLDDAVKRVGSDGRKAMEYVTPILEEMIRRDEWIEERFTKFSDTASPCSGRVAFMYPLHRPPDASYSVVSAVWPPGKPTAPHDHSAWAVIGMVQGRERQTRYKRVDDGTKPGLAHLKDIGSYVAAESDIDYVIYPRDIHQIENVGSEPSVSLHVYGCDIGNVKRLRYNIAKGNVEEWVSGYDVPSTE